MNGNGHTSIELDSATVRLLESLAAAWGVSPEEAVKRAVLQADAQAAPAEVPGRLEAFKELQRRLHLTPTMADAWQADVREGRR